MAGDNGANAEEAKIKCYKMTNDEFRISNTEVITSLFTIRNSSFDIIAPPLGGGVKR